MSDHDWQARAEAAEARASELGAKADWWARKAVELQGERNRAVEALRKIADGAEITEGNETFVHPGPQYARHVLTQLDHSEDTGDGDG